MKNRKAIATLLLANFVSGMAQGISIIAIPTHFAAEGESAQFSLIYTLVTVVTLFWSPVAGTLVDRFNRKYLFLALTTICGLSLFGIALAGWGDMPLWLAALAFAVTFWNFNLHYPSLYAFMQEITERKHYGRIASMLEIQGQLASATAGGLAAVLLDGIPAWGIDAWGLHEVFLLDASTYVVAFLLIISMRFMPIAERNQESGSLFSRLATGWAYLRSHPYILLFGVASYATFVVVLLVNFNVGPLFVEACLDVENSRSTFAAGEAFYAIGAILAGIAIRRIFKRFTAIAAIIMLTSLLAVLFLILHWYWASWYFFLMMLLMGISNAGTRVIRVSYLFERIPNQVIGRSSSIFAVSHILQRIAFLALISLPFFHENQQVVYTFLIFTVYLGIAAGVLGLFYKRLILRNRVEGISD